MRQAQRLVAEFHRKHGHPVESEPTTIAHNQVWLRERLHSEEVQEVSDAMRFHGIDSVAKELADAVYVLLGTACEYGIDIEHAFMEVHRSNMSKPVGEKRDDGKVPKGDYEPVDRKKIVHPFITESDVEA